LTTQVFGLKLKTMENARPYFVVKESSVGVLKTTIWRFPLEYVRRLYGEPALMGRADRARFVEKETGKTRASLGRENETFAVNGPYVFCKHVEET